MSNLIYSPKIPLSRGIVSDPFATLLIENVPANLTLAGRTQYLKDFSVTLKNIEEATEQALTRNHWLSITSGFSAAAAVAGSAAMAPLAGVLVSGAAVVAALAAIADSYLTKSKIEPISETLTRHRIALESQKTIHWAALWELAGTELFCKAVSYSARGFLSEGKLVQQGQDSPFVRAADYAAESLGATYDAVIDAIDSTIAGRQAPQLQRQYAPSLPPVTQPLPPATPQQYSGGLEPMPTQQVVSSTPLAFERPAAKAVSAIRSAYTLILDNPLECRAAFGAQRTGKSYLLSVVSQELHRQGMKIYQINLGSYGTEEDPYWCHCVRSARGDISAMRAYEANKLIDEAIAVVDEFYSQEDAILIFDEWIYAGKKNNAHAKALQPLIDLVADRASILTQTGVKRSKAIWTVAPEFVAGTLVESAKVIKSFSLLYVTIAPGRSIDWVNPRTGKAKPVKFSSSLFDMIKNNYEIEMPTERFMSDRICFIDGEWIEVGDLPPLDPNLRPAIAPTQAQPTLQQQPPVDTLSSDYSEEQKQAAEAAIVATLRATSFHTLWEFARDELGLESSEEIKKMLQGIGEIIFDYDLTELKEKFRLQSKYGVRYSYAGYSKKVAATHRKTGNICALCHKNQSEEAHHTRYLGIEDEPGSNLYALCKPCHEKVAHSRENWQQLSVWKSCNTSEFEARLKLEYQFALVEGEAT